VPARDSHVRCALLRVADTQMAHDDELELTHGDFSRYPGSPHLEPPLPSYSEEDDDAVTLAMRPLEEQLAEPGPELAWMYPAASGAARAAVTKPVVTPPAVIQPSVVSPPPAAVLPAPPVARAPSVRPPAVAPVAAPPAAVAQQPVAQQPVAQPQVMHRAPPSGGFFESAPSPPPAAVRSAGPPPFIPAPQAPSARAVVPASARPAAVRPLDAVQRAHATTSVVRRSPVAHVRPAPKSRGGLLLLAVTTAVAALVVMLGTGVVLYRIGAFEPGSASAAKH
jgi:hypothetical protein